MYLSFFFFIRQKGKIFAAENFAFLPHVWQVLLG